MIRYMLVPLVLRITFHLVGLTHPQAPNVVNLFGGSISPDFCSTRN